MSDDLDFDRISSLARALLAAMAPATGIRASGSLAVTAPAGGGEVTIPRNAYAVPVVSGQLRHDWLFKVGPNPATLNPNQTGGDWPIADGATESVALVSNLGGARHNLPLGTVFRWLPPVPGIAETAALDVATTGGVDSTILRRAAYFEDVSPAIVAKDLFAGSLTDFPAAAVIWSTSSPVEGRTSGAGQGSTRVGQGLRFIRETFTIVVAAGDNTSDTRRRSNGLVAVQAITRLITDRRVNDDCEVLSAIGAGVEVVTRRRLTRTQNLYVYDITVRLNSLLRRVETRTFNQWLTAHLEAALPGREAPEPTDPLTLVDVDDPIPQA